MSGPFDPTRPQHGPARPLPALTPRPVAREPAPARREPAPPPALSAPEPPAFRTPARPGPANARGLAPSASAPTDSRPAALRLHLWHARDVVAQVSQLASANKAATLDEVVASADAIPAMLMTRATLFTSGLLARFGAGPDMSAHEAGPAVVEPTGRYRVASYIAALAREHGFGNCGEKAMSAAVLLADRGLHPVEVFMIDGRDGDHGFCVLGRAPGSDPADASTWGPHAVIVDPWSNESYPAADLVRDPAAHMRGLLPTDHPPRFERFAHIAGADPDAGPGT